jgi:hypothetical protein
VNSFACFQSLLFRFFVMFVLKIIVTGQTCREDFLDALKQVEKLASEGYRSGRGSNDDSSFRFLVTEEK